MTIIRIPIDSELSTYPPTQSTICYGKLGVCPEIVINSFAWDNNVTCRCRFVLVVEYLPEWNNRMAERNRCPLIGLYCRWTTHHLFIRWSTNLFQRRVELSIAVHDLRTVLSIPFYSPYSSSSSSSASVLLLWSSSCSSRTNFEDDYCRRRSTSSFLWPLFRKYRPSPGRPLSEFHYATQ